MPEHAYWPILFIMGVVLVVLAAIIRRSAGFGSGRQYAADNMTLVSAELGLSGRPDRIVKSDGYFIPEEKKSAMRVYPGHVMQLGVYFLLIESEMRKRPPHGFIVLGDGRREKIANTESLRQKVMKNARDMRRAAANPGRPLKPGHKNAAKCRSCAMAAYCNQRVA